LSGLILAIIALWLAVKDRPTVSVGPPLDAKNLLSTQVFITNNGVLPINDVSLAIYVKSLEMKGGHNTYNEAVDGYQLPTSTLQPGEPVTTTFQIIVGNSNLGTGMTIENVGDNPQFIRFDIALITSFRPAWAPFWRRTTTFRFRAVRTSEGMIMQQVPAEDIEKEYRKIATHSFP